MKVKKYKVCPRCDRKCALYEDKCENCGLVFSRLNHVSNSAAKQAIRKKQYNKVLNYKVLPPDVNKWKLFFLALFLGWFGAHFLKVGKYKTFIYMVVSFVLIMLVATSIVPYSWFDKQYLFLIAWACIMPASIGSIIWVVSIFQILFNRFKVPVAIDESLVKQNLDYDTVTDIMNTIKKSNKSALTLDEKEKSKNKKSIKDNLTSIFSSKKSKNGAKPNNLCETKTSKENSENEINRGSNNPKLNAKNESSEIKQSSKKFLKKEKIIVTCASCGTKVKVNKNETICPKCDEPLNEE